MDSTDANTEKYILPSFIEMRTPQKLLIALIKRPKTVLYKCKRYKITKVKSKVVSEPVHYKISGSLMGIDDAEGVAGISVVLT